jgi:pimeloyl-ACP methyl ester carboxylesterase/DNA-binding winged helix-turn-helix (wHTH) protein
VLYTFGDFALNTGRCELLRAGRPQHLEPQVYAVLCYLVAHRDRMVTREELLDHVWGHRFVAPATLSSRIMALRKALGDDGQVQHYIQTVRGRGFRFAAAATEGELDEGTEPASSMGRLGAPLADPALPIEQTIHFCRAFDGTTIAFATSGSGPPLVKPANWLTHLQYDWSSPVWRHWLQTLSRDHTLIRYDERGCGLSERNAEDLSFEAWVRDLESVVDAAGVDRFPMLGISQGCAVAITYAARHPERVSALVLYGGFVLGRFKRARDAEDLRMAEALVQLMPLGWGRDNPAFRDFFASVFLPEGTPEQMRWFSDLQRVTTSPEVGVRLRTTSANVDVRDLASRVRAPTLVLHATGDAAVPFDQGREVAALIPGARFVPLDSRNHVLLESEPAWVRFTAEVEAFLAEHSPDASRGSPPPARRAAIG